MYPHSTGHGNGRAELARIAAGRVNAARRLLDDARQDPQVPNARIGYLRAALIQAERALAECQVREETTDA